MGAGRLFTALVCVQALRLPPGKQKHMLSRGSVTGAATHGFPTPPHHCILDAVLSPSGRITEQTVGLARPFFYVPVGYFRIFGRWRARITPASYDHPNLLCSILL